MYVRIEMLLGVGEQDSTQDAIETAKNAMREMCFDELIDDVLEYDVQER